MSELQCDTRASIHRMHKASVIFRAQTQAAVREPSVKAPGRATAGDRRPSTRKIQFSKRGYYRKGGLPGAVARRLSLGSSSTACIPVETALTRTEEDGRVLIPPIAVRNKTAFSPRDWRACSCARGLCGLSELLPSVTALRRQLQAGSEVEASSIRVIANGTEKTVRPRLAGVPSDVASRITSEQRLSGRSDAGQCLASDHDGRGQAVDGFL